jgi:hypothetical protein
VIELSFPRLQAKRHPLEKTLSIAIWIGIGILRGTLTGILLWAPFYFSLPFPARGRWRFLGIVAVCVGPLPWRFLVSPLRWTLIASLCLLVFVLVSFASGWWWL